jgi:hypothetical protein
MRMIWVLTMAALLSVFSMASRAAEETSVYTFVAEQSTIEQSGGFAGLDRTYGLEGRFELAIDPNAGTAAFTAVDAVAICCANSMTELDPNRVFHLTSLASAVVDEMLALFVGYAEDGSGVAVTLLSRADGSVRLVGQTIPPIDSADFFVFTLDAVAQRYGGGTGEPNDPYQITTAADLLALGENPEDYDRHFILTADIDLAGYAFDRAVIAPAELVCERSGCSIVGTAFSGVFNGQGHEIRNLRIEGGEHGEAMGLFGGVAVEGRIVDLGLENASLKGPQHCVGGLVGFNRGVVLPCRCVGEVHGTAEVGGLVGNNDQGSIISSYSTATVSGTYYIGGLVGRNEYESPLITSSFWDIETSGQTSMCGHVVAGDGCDETCGKTTAEMQNIDTYLDAGWDFIGETANGTDDIWWIDEGQDYPRLWWEMEK